MYTSNQAEVRGWYGLGPELENGIARYVSDDYNYGRQRWNVHTRTSYNNTWRGMTPVWNVGNRILWLGGQPAAWNIQNLRHCGILQRMSALGHWGCRKTDGITDLPGIRMNNCLMAQLDFDPSELRSVLHRIDMALDQGGLLVFCKQGCRRGAALVGCYLMAKTRLEPWYNLTWRGMAPAFRQAQPWARRSASCEQHPEPQALVQRMSALGS